jgi:two-component system sensor histidine kinase DegS
MVETDAQQDAKFWEELKTKYQSEIEQNRRELKEISMMLEQSQLEVNKLAQRNASITAHLGQVQSQFDSLPRPDIRMAYDAALDAQQRLFVMRGQVEKLQSDHSHLKRYVESIEKILELLENSGGIGSVSKSSSTTTRTVEMLIQAQEAERFRLSRQMHDGPAQSLSNFILQTEIAMRLFDMDADRAKSELVNLKHSATNTFQQVRDFIFELRPMMLDDLGLIPTLKRYVDALKDQAGLDVRFTFMGSERRLESYQEVMVFRAIQELLNNVIHHSQASEAKIFLDMGDTNVKVTVEDNGRGFSTDQLSDHGGTGLRVIQDRVEMLGGSMQVDSEISHGTRIDFSIPGMLAKDSAAVVKPNA